MFIPARTMDQAQILHACGGGTEQKAREFEHLKKIEEIRAKDRQLRTTENRNLVTPNLAEQAKGESAQIAA